MDGAVKPLLRSPEEVAIAHYYQELLSAVVRPVQLAELLASNRIISRETKESVATKKDKESAMRTLLDAVQCALAQSTHTATLMSSVYFALERSGFPSSYSMKIKAFIAGECNSVKASVE